MWGSQARVRAGRPDPSPPKPGSAAHSLSPRLFLVLLLGQRSGLVFFLNKFIYFYLFYFWLRWVFVAVRGLLIVAAPLVAEEGL